MKNVKSYMMALVLTVISVLSGSANGQVKLTASRDYVDREIVKATSNIYEFVEEKVVGVTNAVQADWSQSDTNAMDYIRNKPYIPGAINVDTNLSSTSTNPVQNKVVMVALDARPTKAQIDAGWWSEWTVLRDGVDVTAQVGQPKWSESVEAWDTNNACVAGDLNPTFGYGQSGQAFEDDDAIGWTALLDDLITEVPYTATRHRVAAPVPTKTSDLTNDSGFLTQHQQLTPVYSKTTTFSEWTCNPATYSGSPITIVENPAGTFAPYSNGVRCGEHKTLSDSVTSITWDSSAWGDGDPQDLIATRTRTDVIGYTLGTQTNSVLAATNSLIKHSEKRNALFVITLNGPGEDFTDIELKATTNNFSSSAVSSNRLVYYCHTSIQKGDYHNPGSDIIMDGVKLFASSQGSDVREWKKLDFLYDATNKVTTIALLVSTNDCLRTEGVWLNEDNEELIWSYVRTVNFNVETNSSGRQIWRQIMPTRWYKEIPEWAK